MRFFISIVALAVVGCSIPRASDSAQFYEQETTVAKICLSPLESMPIEARLKVDPQSGRSPMTNSARCYESQMRGVVAAMNYSHALQVENYSNYLVQLSEARDKGLIDTPTALANYKTASTQFRQIIAIADKRQQDVAMRELGDRLQVFASQMSGVIASGEAQRAANRPVLCTSTGVYQTNSIICR